IQIRLATAGWPVAAGHPSETFFHLTIWHYAPEGRAYLHVAHGRRLELPPVPPLPSQDEAEGGFAARFRLIAQGYVMTCRIPWHLLGQAHGPRDTSLGLCWEVCWSNQAGNHFVGKLTEFFDPVRLREIKVTDPDQDLLPGKQSYREATCWGKAVFAPPQGPR